MKNNNGCFITLFLILIYITAVIIVRNNNSENKQKKVIEQKKKVKIEREEEIAFILNYDFDVKEFGKQFEKCQVGNNKYYKPNLPIIVYKKDKYYSTIFDYSLNKKVKEIFKSFKIKNINTVVILKDTLVDIGRYTRGNARAIQQQIIISYIDIKTKKEVFFDIVKGEDPPKSIKSRHLLEGKVLGSPPTEENILEAIQKNLN
ncbi:MAG: hypothetical protein V4548_04945 [Bacteroidota bacterium]